MWSSIDGFNQIVNTDSSAIKKNQGDFGIFASRPIKSTVFTPKPTPKDRRFSGPQSKNYKISLCFIIADESLLTIPMQC